MKNKKLSEKNLSKLSDISNVDLEILTSLNNIGVLDITGVYSILIKTEYNRLFKEKTYTGKQIIGALANEYGISRYYIETIIYDKGKNKVFHCNECGEEMSKYKFTKNKGVCDKCIIDKINRSI